MKLRLPLDGPAEQPLDIVPRHCNTFHFIYDDRYVNCGA